MPGLSSAIGSIHVHIDGGEDKELAKHSARFIDPNFSRSEIARIIQFVDGPQRTDHRELYAEHTPIKGGKESLQFFSTTVLYEGDSDPSDCELAEVEDKVRLVLGKISAQLRATPREPGGIVVE